MSIRDNGERYEALVPDTLDLAERAGHIRAHGDISWPPTADRMHDTDHYRQVDSALHVMLGNVFDRKTNDGYAL